MATPASPTPTTSTRSTHAASHAEYLSTLHRPSIQETHRIDAIQTRLETAIVSKYHQTPEEQQLQHDAATTIQKAYRGHRQRRQLDGLTLDPSERWVAAIREWRFRNATTPVRRSGAGANGGAGQDVGSEGRARAASDLAKRNWQRVGAIAEHAGGGADSPSPDRERGEFLSVPAQSSLRKNSGSSRDDEGDYNMLMDMRYFLEMVDQKHRYGANLLAYHEQWLHSKTDQNFFYWLDRGEGRHLSLSVVSRERLDRERVRYLSKDERRDYLVNVDEEGRLRWMKNGELITTSVEQFKDSMTGIVPKDNVDVPSFGDEAVKRELDETRHLISRTARNRSASDESLGSLSGHDDDISDSDSEPILDSHSEHQTTSPKKKGGKKNKRIRVSPAAIFNQLLKASVRPGTWIYVADTVGRLYVGIKSSGAFQHASFLSGARISSAGLISIENGVLTYLSPLSGHYRPTTKSFRLFLQRLREQGVDMSKVRISGAFKVLLTMEYYGKVTKHETKKKKDQVAEKMGMPSGKEAEVKETNSRSLTQEPAVVSTAKDSQIESATSEIERHWSRNHEHKSSIGKLMDDLHLRHRHSEG